MKERLKLAISDIQVTDRQRTYRKDFIEQDLAPSMARIGLIQPIVVNADNRLIAGQQRLAAAKHLGWTEIDVVYKETLTEDDLQEMELTENLSRSANTWQETCIAVAKIHALRKRRAAANFEEWTQVMTGRLFNYSKTHVNYCFIIARRLLSSPDDPCWKCDNMNDAWKNVILREVVEKNDKELADRAKVMANHGVMLEDIRPDADTEEDEMGLAVPLPDKPIVDFNTRVQTKEEALERYLKNPNNDPNKFEDYWLDKQRLIEERRNTVYLSNRLFHVDSITFMENHVGTYDHIITDIPYGIDMDMLNQQNPHGSMVDIDTVVKEHDVEQNEALYVKFFPAAYNTLKENGFLITWCDQMQWQYMYDLATKAGFKVQRWPIVWNKVHRCMNQCAQFNFTKRTEIAMVCRKGNALLVEQPDTNVVTASNDAMRSMIGHPFAKPYECWEFLAKAVSIEGQHILEPFAGRGSGVISMLKMNRIVTAVEINEAHYNALLEVVKRWYLSLNPNFKFL